MRYENSHFTYLLYYKAINPINQSLPNSSTTSLKITGVRLKISQPNE